MEQEQGYNLIFQSFVVFMVFLVHQMCISSICLFKLLLHFHSLKWTDDQREKQEVISSEISVEHKFSEKYLGNYLQKTTF